MLKKHKTAQLIVCPPDGTPYMYYIETRLKGNIHSISRHGNIDTALKELEVLTEKHNYFKLDTYQLYA